MIAASCGIVTRFGGEILGCCDYDCGFGIFVLGIVFFCWFFLIFRLMVLRLAVREMKNIRYDKTEEK